MKRGEFRFIPFLFLWDLGEREADLRNPIYRENIYGVKNYPVRFGVTVTSYGHLLKSLHKYQES